MTQLINSAGDLMALGGIVMWPLLALSVLSAALLFERCWFFLRTNSASRKARARVMARYLREKNNEAARQLALKERSLYGRVVEQVAEEAEAGGVAEVDIVEAYRPRIERFMPTLSTIITVAPMLGILGTVLGIIASFQLLSDPGVSTDPRSVSQGIAEALITTAAGLVIAIFTLFPYNALRVQVQRSLSVVESLAWAASSGASQGDDNTQKQENHDS